MHNITRINITKLHGYKNYCITLKDNRLILVGENGSGKTTILRMLFYLLSKQWKKLASIDFLEISVEIDNVLVKFDKREYLKSIEKLADLPLPERLKSMLLEDSVEEAKYHITRYAIPERIAKEYINNKYIDNIEHLLSKLNLNVLYLPTYRRIEQEARYIFGDSDAREDYAFRASRLERRVVRPTSSIEQVEFGMNDVAKTIENKISSIKEYSRNRLNELSMGYLGDVIDKEYNNLNLDTIKSIDDEKIKSILDRIDEKILSRARKNRIEKTIYSVKDGSTNDTEDKVVCYYFNKLLKFHSELEEKEKELQTFCNVCNQYFYDKQIVYTTDISVKILNKKHSTEHEDMTLSQILNTLSSGEKQIMSIFSKLYLKDDDKEYRLFVLIDEPELSLSVPWQTKLIPDMNQGKYCGGIIAVTHSPFIYDSDAVGMYAHSLEEFKK